MSKKSKRLRTIAAKKLRRSRKQTGAAADAADSASTNATIGPEAGHDPMSEPLQRAVGLDVHVFVLTRTPHHAGLLVAGLAAGHFDLGR